MRLVKIKSILPTLSILSVDQSTFADISDITNDVIRFDMTYGISIENAGISAIESYERVRVTVTDRNAVPTTSAIPRATNFSAVARDPLQLLKTNPIAAKPSPAVLSSLAKSSALSLTSKSNSTVARTLASSRVAVTTKTTAPVPAARLIFSDAVSSNLLVGAKMIEALVAQDVYIDRVEDNFSTALKECLDKTYSSMILRARDTKLDPSSIADESRISKFDTVDLLSRLNDYKVDLTEPTGIPSVPVRSQAPQILGRSLHTSAQLPANQTVDNPLSRAAADFYLSLGLYYLHDVKKSPAEDSQVWYESSWTYTPLTKFESTVSLSIPVANKNATLDVKFDLFKSGQTSPAETVTVSLNVTRYFDAFTSVKYPPQISSRALDAKGNTAVFIEDLNKTGTVSKFNVYVKDISSVGEITPYKRMGSVNNTRMCQFNFTNTAALSLLRVVPVDAFGRESNIFTNIVIGPGHDVVGKMAICPKYGYDGHTVSIDIFNVPRDASKIHLYRRNCSKSPDAVFELATEVLLKPGIDVHTIDDLLGVVPGAIFEYYVTATTSPATRLRAQKTFCSNYAFFKHPAKSQDKKSLTVEIQNYVSVVDTSGMVNVAFDLVTTLSPEEKAIITESLKAQLGELYEQYLNPANNLSSPLGEDKYSDLVVHEVVRTNLRTAEREVFELVSAGKFADNPQTRSVSNIKDIDPLNDYYYQVFTYKRNPITLFKNYVAFGTDDHGRDWFYSPYKWRQPAVLSSGRLYADDTAGVPIVDTYDSFTADACGLTATHMSRSAVELTQIDSVRAERIDRHTVQVSWNYSTSLSKSRVDLYDSFIVLKVVNGVRSYVGRSAKNFIYHYLTPDDVGSVYYIVVPIVTDIEFDDPGFSNDIYVDPDGIVEKTVASAKRAIPDSKTMKFTKGWKI